MGCSQILASFIPALLLAVVSLTIFPSHAILHQNLVTICSKTSNPSLCQQNLGNDPQTVTADLPKLSLISINEFSQQQMFRDNGPLLASKKLVLGCGQAIRVNSLQIEVMNKLMILSLLCNLRIPNFRSIEAMTFSACSSQLPALFLVLLIVHPVLADPATQQRIDRVCRQMEDYGFCNRTYQFIVQLQATTADPATRAALENCRIGCSQVRQAFVQANSYFNQRDYANMVEVERAAPRGEAFYRPPTPESPLVERKRELRILIAMAVIVGHILAPSSGHILVFTKTWFIVLTQTLHLLRRIEL